MEIGAKLVVQIGGDTLLYASDLPHAQHAIDEDGQADARGEQGREPGHAPQIGFLSKVTPVEFRFDVGALGFEVVATGQLVHPFTDGENGTIEVVTIGEKTNGASELARRVCAGHCDGSSQRNVLPMGEQLDLGEAESGRSGRGDRIRGDDDVQSEIAMGGSR